MKSKSGNTTGKRKKAKNVKEKPVQVKHPDPASGTKAVRTTTGEKKALGAGRDLFEVFSDNMLDGLVVIDWEGNILFANKAAYRIVGMKPRKTPKNLNMAQFLHPGDMEQAMKDHMLTRDGNGGFLARYRIIPAKGDIRWIQTIGQRIPFEGKDASLVTIRDITDLSKAEQALKESEKRFRSLHEASFGGIGIHEKGIILDCNKGLADMTGYSMEELMGMNGLELIAPQWREYVMEKILSGYEEPYDAEGLRKDGTVYALAIQGKNIPYHGRTVRVTEFRDISARKRVEDALRESEERYRKIAGAITDYIYTVQIEGGRPVRTDHSPACRAVTGYTVEEFDADPFLWFTMVVEEDRERVREYFSRILAEEPSVPIEHRIYHKDGSVRWVVNMPVVHRNESGDIIAYDGVLSDITARKKAEEALRESEERHRLMAELTGKLVYDYDVASGRITWHGAVFQLTGYTPEEFGSIDFRMLNDMIHPEDRSNAMALLDEALRKCGPYNAEYRLRRKDGSYVYVEDHGVFLCGESGSATRMLGSLGDISLRKEAEEAIREAERRYRTLFESANDAIFIMSSDRFVECNIMTLRIFGCDGMDEIIGHAPWEFSPPLQPDGSDSLKKARELIRCAFENGPQNFYWKHVRKDGTPFDAEVSLNPFELGDQLFMQAIVRDITERKRVEAALHLSEERIRGITDNLPGAVYQFYARDTGEMGLYYVSERVTELLGLDSTPEDFFKRFTEAVAPEDRERFLDSILEVVRTVSSWDCEVRFLKPDGQERYIRGISQPERRQGEIVFNGVLLDITDRKLAEKALMESEERFRSLIQSSSDMIVILDERGRIAYETPSVERILRYPHGSMIGEDPLDYIHPEDIPNVVPELAEVYEDVNTMVPTEFRFRRADGSWVYLEAIGNNLVDYPGINGIVITARDITERKKAQELKLDMERRLLHAQKLESLGVMAGGIAHDFNNLLMAILGNLDLALIDLSPVSRSRPFIDQALVAARRAADLTNQMLAYTGKGRFDLKTFDLSELVQEMAHLLKASVSKTVTLNILMESGLPLIVADPSQIQQIIMNLVVNASEAIGEQPGVVTIATGVLESDQEYLQGSRIKEKPDPGTFVFIEVTDTGCGMDGETKDRLFDPFFTTKFTGRGLGMAAVLGIVSGHKGAILVESGPGRGSSIRVLFPASDGMKGLSDRKPEQVPSEYPGEGEARAAGTILIADDDDMVLKICRAMVERIGYNVLTAVDGEEAVRIFREHGAAIVCAILDLSMPRLDGMAAFDEIRRIRPDVKVILSSGYNEQEATKRFSGRGLAGFIKKPYQLSNLRAELSRVMRET